MASTVVEVSGEARLGELKAQSAAEGKLLMLFFWGSFHEASAPGGQLADLVNELARAHSDAIFAKVDAESVDDVTDSFGVESVPHFVFMSGPRVIASLTSSDGKAIAAQLSQAKALVSPATSSSSSSSSAAAPAAPAASSAPAPAPAAARSLASDPALHSRIRGITQSAHAVLFMKGTPANPRCKFSRPAVERMAATGVPFGSFDVLEDPAVREGIKEFGGRQTFPQLWVAGSLVGGGDDIERMAADGTLAATIAPKALDTAAPAKPAAHVKCERLVASAPVILFMKGSPDAPRCGFSARTVQLLREQGVSFDSFDVLSDPDVRQGLKECLGKWATFPQLYVGGEFVGGLDILKEMVEDGDEPLAEQLGLA